MRPIYKKALAAVAAKQIYERVQEARRPQKPSLVGRLFKLALVGGLVGGIYYAYKNGLLGGSRDRYGTDTYPSGMSYQGPRDDFSEATSPDQGTAAPHETDPIGTPST